MTMLSISDSERHVQQALRCIYLRPGFTDLSLVATLQLELTTSDTSNGQKIFPSSPQAGFG